MIVPTTWYLFVDEIEHEIKRHGDLERAVSALSTSVTEDERVKLIDVFKKAQTLERADCEVLQLEGTEIYLVFSFEDDEGCSDFYKFAEETFRAAQTSE